MTYVSGAIVLMLNRSSGLEEEFSIFSESVGFAANVTCME